VTPSTEPAGPADGVEPADRVAAAVRAVPGVAGLHPGPYGEVATCLPGRRVVGVRLRPDRAAVHVALRQGAPLLATADLVRRAATDLLQVPVTVAVEDLLPEHGEELP
jgi:hypothetical protein